MHNPMTSTDRSAAAVLHPADAQTPREGAAAPATWLSTAPLPPADEPRRLAELRACAILDTEPEAEFDRLVQLAAVVCGAPCAAFTLVDAQRQWYKARAGVPVQQIARDKSFCAHAILQPDQLLEVPDASRLGWADPQPWGPQGPLLRFYAGVPVRTRDGSAIGTLCVMDQVPRRLTGTQRDALVQLARTAGSLVDLRRQSQGGTAVDRLTGLPHWNDVEARFEQDPPERGMVCLVQLKTIPQVQAALGARVADGLIRQAAQRLRVFEQRGATVARLRRGLFALFFPQARPDAFVRAEATELADALGQPYEVDQVPLVGPVQLGFASFPEDGRTLDEAVDAAASALQAAAEREQPLAFFDKTVDAAHGLHRRLEPQLRRALELDEFVNYYQPKLELSTGRIVGVEALVRWMDPRRGLVPPGDFVPALEATGLIGEVGQRVLESAIADWRSWRDAGLAAPRISVNVAAAQLRSDGFVAALQRALKPLKGKPQAVGIEIAEGVLVANLERASEVLRAVRALGVAVAVDDFGTGSASLAHLMSLPIDELKIDRAFIRKLTTDPAYEGIVRSCIALARSLNLAVVAEGVETDAQEAALRALGCQQAQGFLYSQPVPAHQIVRMLKAGPLGG